MKNFQRRRVYPYGLSGGDLDGNHIHSETYQDDQESMKDRGDRGLYLEEAFNRPQQHQQKQNQRTEQCTSCKGLKWYFRAYVYGLHALVYEYLSLLRHRGGNDHSSDTEESFLASLPFEAGFPLRILTYMTVLWVIEFLYLRFHIFVIPILIRGVAYLIFALTIDALCYYICSDLALGITIEACPVWVVGLIFIEKLLTETLLRRLHYCSVGQGHIKDDLELFIEGLMTPPPPGCCGGAHRCPRHRRSLKHANGHSQSHDYGRQLHQCHRGELERTHDPTIGYAHSTDDIVEGIMSLRPVRWPSRNAASLKEITDRFPIEPNEIMGDFPQNQKKSSEIFPQNQDIIEELPNKLEESF